MLFISTQRGMKGDYSLVDFQELSLQVHTTNLPCLCCGALALIFNTLQVCGRKQKQAEHSAFA